MFKKSLLNKELSNKGFTLVELIFIFIIIGILVGLGVQQYVSALAGVEERAHEANIRLLNGAGKLLFFSIQEDAEGVYTKNSPGNLGTYLDQWPEVPSNYLGFNEDVTYKVIISDRGEVEVLLEDL